MQINLLSSFYWGLLLFSLAFFSACQKMPSKDKEPAQSTNNWHKALYLKVSWQHGIKDPQFILSHYSLDSLQFSMPKDSKVLLSFKDSLGKKMAWYPIMASKKYVHFPLVLLEESPNYLSLVESSRKPQEKEYNVENKTLKVIARRDYLCGDPNCGQKHGHRQQYLGGFFFSSEMGELLSYQAYKCLNLLLEFDGKKLPNDFIKALCKDAELPKPLQNTIFTYLEEISR